MKRIRVGSIVLVNDDLNDEYKIARIISINRSIEQVACMILNDFLEDDHIVYVGMQKIKEYDGNLR